MSFHGKKTVYTYHVRVHFKEIHMKAVSLVLSVAVLASVLGGCVVEPLPARAYVGVGPAYCVPGHWGPRGFWVKRYCY